jgi:hypothetical protein
MVLVYVSNQLPLSPSNHLDTRHSQSMTFASTTNMPHEDSLTLSSRTGSSHRRFLSLGLLPTRHEKLTGDLSTHTLRKRPWRRYATPFPTIISYQYPGAGTEEEPYLIDWLPKREGEGAAVVDWENPLSWPEMYKWLVMVLVAVATLAVAMASSAL